VYDIKFIYICKKYFFNIKSELNMKLLLSILICLISAVSYCQYQVNILNIVANDLVYDHIGDKIYISIPSANGPNGNSLGVIKCSDCTLEKTISIGSEPSVLAISDNARYIYVGFNGSSTVRRFNVGTQTPEIQFTIGSSTHYGPYYAEDIEVMPGNSNTIAVSRKRLGVSPRHAGVAVFDNGIMRDNVTQSHTGSNKIEFSDHPNWVYGYNNESTEFGLRRLTIDSSGIYQVGVFQNVFGGFGSDFIYANNTVYSTNGKAVDVSNAPFVTGQFFSNMSGRPVYDSLINKVFYATYTFSGSNVHFRRYNNETFIEEYSILIPQVKDNIISMITCGTGCYAFNSADNKVVIIKDTTTNTTDDLHATKTTIYPNPAIDFINVQTTHAIHSAFIFNVTGQIQKHFNDISKPLFVGDLDSGIYFLQVIHQNNEKSNYKFVKN